MADDITREILGYDPDAPKDAGVTDLERHGAKSERHGWPEDWKDRFNKTLVSRMPGSSTLYSDPDKLFGIKYREDFNQFGRYYYRYKQDHRRFEEAAYFFEAVKPDGTPRRLSYNLRADNDTWVNVSFNDEKGWAPVQLQKTINRRGLVARYIDDGTFGGISFTVYPQPDPSETEQDYTLPSEGELSFYEEYGWNNLGDFQFEIEEKGDYTELRRIDGNTVVDIIEFPMKIDPDQLKSELFPSALLKDPAIPRTELDDTWRRVDPFNEVGIKWTPVANDSFHSLHEIEPQEV